MQEIGTTDIHDFVKLVRQYLSLVDGMDEIRAHELLFRAAIVLPKIYSLGITLPDVGPFLDDIEEDEDSNLDQPEKDVESSIDKPSEDADSTLDKPERYAKISKMDALREKIGKYDKYWEVFNPITEDESLTASLSDDLSDIYWDLKEPLQSYDSGKELDATWAWRFNLKTHCGDHLVDSLRAIHRLINEYMDPYYVNKSAGNQGAID